MSRLDATLDNLAPGVTACRDLDGSYNPRRGLAIYCMPMADYSPSSPGVVLGEALAARSGLGCTLLEGIPAKVPEGAAVVAPYAALKKARPDLLESVPEPADPGQYAIKLGRSALVTALSGEGLALGMQTLAMLVLRHGENAIPGCIILDTPLCRTRCLAVELDSNEFSISLLMQIVSFAATFKANAIHLILNDDFDPSREIPGMDTFIQACHSFGMAIGVRMRVLGPLLAGTRTLLETWSAIRAAARLFGAEEAGIDDPCPVDASPKMCEKITASLLKGDVGLKRVSIDGTVLRLAGASGRELRAAGVHGWYRLWGDATPPGPEWSDIPLSIDVQAPTPGFTSRTSAAYHERLDAAARSLRTRSYRRLIISFRGLGISHMWQNMLYPAATGLVAGWGEPGPASEAALRYSNLLYGDSARAVMNMWEVVSEAFPGGLTDEEERLVRRVAFGEWPGEAEMRILSGVDWVTVTRKIREGAEALKTAAGDLSRNAVTLGGARLGLYALSWLHCFVVLLPELERRRAERWDGDGRTEPIAAELYNNFLAWHSHLQDVYAESGLEVSEMGRVEAMGLRLKGLCEGIFE